MTLQGHEQLSVELTVQSPVCFIPCFRSSRQDGYLTPSVSPPSRPSIFLSFFLSPSSLRNNMFELADHLVGIYKTNNCTKSITIDPRSFVVAAQQQVDC